MTEFEVGPDRLLVGPIDVRIDGLDARPLDQAHEEARREDVRHGLEFGRLGVEGRHRLVRRHPVDEAIRRGLATAAVVSDLLEILHQIGQAGGGVCLDGPPGSGSREVGYPPSLVGPGGRLWTGGILRQFFAGNAEFSS